MNIQMEVLMERNEMSNKEQEHVTDAMEYEREIDKEAEEYYNEQHSGKVENQNKTHNARREAYGPNVQIKR